MHQAQLKVSSLLDMTLQTNTGGLVFALHCFRRASVWAQCLCSCDHRKSPGFSADADRPVDICNVCVGSTGNNETATASKRGNKRGHSALKQDSDSDRDGSDNHVPGSQSAAAAAAAKAKK